MNTAYLPLPVMQSAVKVKWNQLVPIFMIEELTLAHLLYLGRNPRYLGKVHWGGI